MKTRFDAAANGRHIFYFCSPLRRGKYTFRCVTSIRVALHLDVEPAVCSYSVERVPRRHPTNPSGIILALQTAMSLDGKHFELRAQEFVQHHGVKILEKNLRFRFAEIDLVLEDHNDLVFVEIRARKKSSLLEPIQTVNQNKQNRIRAGANAYLPKYQGRATGIRFDLLSWNGKQWSWMKNVF